MMQTLPILRHFLTLGLATTASLAQGHREPAKPKAAPEPVSTSAHTTAPDPAQRSTPRSGRESAAKTDTAAKVANAAAAAKQAAEFGVPINQFYDVRDLVRADLVATSGESPPRDSRPTVADLADFTAGFAAPRLAPGEQVVPVGDGYLAVRANPTSQASIAANLAELRRRRNEQVLVEIRVIKIPETKYTEQVAPHLAGDFDDAEAEDRLTQAPVGLFAPGEATKSFVDGVEKAAEVLTSPKFITRYAQSAEVSVGGMVAYIRDFEVEVRHASLIADPIVDTVFDGYRCRALICPKTGQRIGIDLEMTAGRVDRPIPEFQTTLAGSTTPLTLQLPNSVLHRLRTTVVLPDGGTAVFALPAYGKEGEPRQRQLVVVRVTSAEKTLPRNEDR